MTGYVLTPRAHDDLSQIWDYTAETWGIEQADQYIQDLVATFRALAEGSKTGTAANQIRLGYFQRVAGKHLIFYTKNRHGIRIVRILHQQMDIPRHIHG